jgi:hypothetical protein
VVRLRLALAVALAGALAAVSLAAGAPQVPPACRGGQLRGTFTYVPGSGAAGHLSYALRLRNVTRITCWVSGIPRLRLLDSRYRALPTRVVPARPGVMAVRVVLRRSQTARAEARFSPTVSGPGEPANRQCEPTAAVLRVTLTRGRSVLAPIRPRTPVCEHGRMVFSMLARA